MRFAKWQGLGNDYIIVDEADIPAAHSRAEGGLSDEAVRAICDRNFGVGGDGVLVLGSADGADARMLIHNPDASQAEMCGNGIRMAARHLVATGRITDTSFAVDTLGGVVRPTVLDDGRVRVDMGIATSEGIDEVALAGGARFSGHVISVGNPHFVIRQDPHEIDLHGLGPQLEHHERFPNRTNVEFYRVDADGTVVMRVWERGAGETLACGTGACAVGLAAVLDAGCDSPVRVQLPGGMLEIEVPAGDISDTGCRVFMTGPAEHIYDGDVDLDAIIAAARPASVATPALS